MKSKSSHENARENDMIQWKEKTKGIREKRIGFSVSPNQRLKILIV